MSVPVPVSNSRAESATDLVPLPESLTGSTPSWVISLIGHLLILACLWPIHMATSMFGETVVSGTVEEEEPVAPVQQEALHFDTSIAEEIGTHGDSASDPGDRVAPLGPAMETPRDPVLNVVGTATALGTKQIAISRPMLDVGVATPDRELSDVVETTGSSEHAGGIRGAVDRLTIEIEASLRQENTLVVWLFDATPSMKERREQIADRFDNIYRQLGLLGVANHGALKTAVATFGRTVEFLTRKPVDDVASVQKAIHKIKDDGDPDKDSVENVFGACLSDQAERFRSFRTGTKDRRRVMIVAVTDERGSDFGRVEEAIVKLRKLGMRVYCVGDDAVFGRERHFFPHVFQDGYQGLGYTLRGPETARLESVQLPFWGRGGYGEITSGFGPYALCRLCAETGGLYLISEELPGPKFDVAVLRNYLPDYRPLREYEAERGRNAAKAALVQAAVLSAENSGFERIPQPRTHFRADSDNTLRREISDAQKPLAELDYRLTELGTLLEAGEKSRSQLDTPRWRAPYDLALGRVLALRARALGYNVMLADMKSLPRQFQTPGDNTWRAVPASEDHAPPRSQKFAKRARQYLEGVINEHRGTQWELLAREELKAPMAWDWEELHVDYPPPAPPRPRRNGIQLEEDRQREMMRRQQQQEHQPVKQ